MRRDRPATVDGDVSQRLELRHDADPGLAVGGFHPSDSDVPLEDAKDDPDCPPEEQARPQRSPDDCEPGCFPEEGDEAEEHEDVSQRDKVGEEEVERVAREEQVDRRPRQARVGPCEGREDGREGAVECLEVFREEGGLKEEGVECRRGEHLDRRLVARRESQSLYVALAVGLPGHGRVVASSAPRRDPSCGDDEQEQRVGPVPEGRLSAQGDKDPEEGEEERCEPVRVGPCEELGDGREELYERGADDQEAQDGRREGEEDVGRARCRPDRCESRG